MTRTSYKTHPSVFIFVAFAYAAPFRGSSIEAHHHPAHPRRGFVSRSRPVASSWVIRRRRIDSFPLRDCDSIATEVQHDGAPPEQIRAQRPVAVRR